MSTAKHLLAAAITLAAAGTIVSAQQNRPPATGAPARVLLQPTFTPGQVMRYRMRVQSASNTRPSGVIRDPQGPGMLDVTWDATIRLEVSASENGSSAAGAPVRLRITYESSQATLRSDNPEPRADDIQRQYAELAGRSLEFTLEPGGGASDIRGLEGLVADERARGAVQQWIAQLSAGSAVPAGGVVPGQTWNALQPAELPLAGLSWRTDFTYLRNEPCRLAGTTPPDGSAPAVAAPPERADCAVILSRLALITTRPVRDPTPEAYRRNNLRTGGRWSGTGQNLTYVSLDTGWIVSSTQESTQEMDITIADAKDVSAGVARHAGTVTMHSQILLLGGDAPSPAANPR